MTRVYKNVLFEKTNEELKEITIMAPIVGIYYKPPEIGAFLKKGFIVGIMKHLNSIFHLRIPEKLSGFVSEIFTEDIANPVEYKQPLFKLVSGELASQNIFKDKSTSGTANNLQTSETSGSITILSPTDGIFYRKPNPDSPAYTNEGDKVLKGAVLGLVEVMKSFNQIKYEGHDLPEEALVREIIVQDGGEIKSGQVIITLDPI